MQKIIVPLLIFFIAASCSSSEENENPNENISTKEFNPKDHTCDYHNEALTDDRFGAKIETAEGEELIFCSVEGLIGHLLENPSAESESKKWVVDYNKGKQLIPVEDARFFRTELIHSPGGLQLLSYTGKKELEENFHVAYGGGQISWEDAKKYVAEKWDLQAQ